jgi:hypothetical protein
MFLRITILFLFLNLLNAAFIRLPTQPNHFYFGDKSKVDIYLMPFDNLIMTNDNRDNSKLESQKFNYENFLKKRAILPDMNQNALDKIKKRGVETYEVSMGNINDMFEELMAIIEEKEKVQSDEEPVRKKRQVGSGDTQMVIGTFQAMMRPMTLPGTGSLPNISSQADNSTKVEEDKQV